MLVPVTHTRAVQHFWLLWCRRLGAEVFERLRQHLSFLDSHPSTIRGLTPFTSDMDSRAAAQQEAVFRVARPAPAQSVSARALPLPPPLSSSASPRPVPVTMGMPPNMGLSDVLMLASLGVSGGSAPGATGSAQRMDPTGSAAKAHHGFPGACSVGLCLHLVTPVPGLMESAGLLPKPSAASWVCSLWIYAAV